MSTNCRIGVLNTDNTIESIYCHWNGYPEYTAPMLSQHYNSEELARQLVALGDISVLCEKLKPEPGTEHSFDKPQDGVTVAYHRDRNENWVHVKPETYHSKQNFVRHADCSYLYLYDVKEQKWKMCSNIRFVDIPKQLTLSDPE